MAGAVRLARAAMPRMVTRSTPTSATIVRVALRIRYRVKSFMIGSVAGGSDIPRRRQNRPLPQYPPAADSSSDRVNAVHFFRVARLTAFTVGIAAVNVVYRAREKE